jgi:hypothetical protein
MVLKVSLYQIFNWEYLSAHQIGVHSNYQVCLSEKDDELFLTDVKQIVPHVYAAALYLRDASKMR